MINGRKSGRSRGRRKICCGAAALASCLPLCLTAAEAGEYSEVSTQQTITEETHNTEKTRFAVTDKEQNRGGALLLEAPYFLAGGSVFEGTQAAESGGAVYADSKGRIRGEGPLTFSGNNARDGGAVYLEASENNVFASGTSFTGNRSDGSGGALYISDGSVLEIAGGSSFTGNAAGEKGGAIYNSGTLVLDTTDGDITFTDNKAGGTGNDIHLGQSQSNAPLITITGTHSVTLTGGLTMDNTWYDADDFGGEAPSVNDLAGHTLITFSKENLQGNLSLGGSLTSGKYNKLLFAGGTTDIKKSFTLSEGSLLVLYGGTLNVGGDFTAQTGTETVALRKENSVSGKTILPADFGALFSDTDRLAHELNGLGEEPVPSPDRDSVILHARGGIASSDGQNGTIGVRNYTLKISGSGENGSGRIAMQNGALEISGVTMAIPALEAVEENNIVSIVDGSAVTMDSLTAGAGTAILVGNETSSGSLTVRELTLGGGVLTCDPDFSSGGTPSTAELSFASGVDGTLNAGRNSIVGLGSGSLAAAQKGLADWEARTGGSFGGSVKAVLGISSPQTLTGTGALNVDGSFTSSSAPAVSGGEARFAGDSLLITDASTERDGKAALSGTGSAGSRLTAESGAKLYISGGRAGDTLTVTSAFPDTDVASDAWKGSNLTLDSALLAVTSAGTEGDSYVVRLRAADTPLPDPVKDTAEDGISPSGRTVHLPRVQPRLWCSGKRRCGRCRAAARSRFRAPAHPGRKPRGGLSRDGTHLPRFTWRGSFLHDRALSRQPQNLVPVGPAHLPEHKPLRARRGQPGCGYVRLPRRHHRGRRLHVRQHPEARRGPFRGRRLGRRQRRLQQNHEQYDLLGSRPLWRLDQGRFRAQRRRTLHVKLQQPEAGAPLIHAHGRSRSRYHVQGAFSRNPGRVPLQCGRRQNHPARRRTLHKPHRGRVRRRFRRDRPRGRRFQPGSRVLPCGRRL